MDRRELIHGKMNRVVAGAVVKRDISHRGKNDGERCSVRSGGGGQSCEDGVACEHGHGVDGDDKGSNIFAPDSADAGGSGTGDNTRNVTAFAYMARRDEEAEGGMVANDSLCEYVQTVEWVVGGLEIEGRQHRAFASNVAIKG
jgi:hypothetical protein